MARMGATLITLLLLLSAQATQSQTPMTAFVGATLVNPGAQPVPNATIIVEGERIVRVGAGIPTPTGARVVDVSGRWIIPGLVDGHVHFFQSGGLYTRPDVVDLRKHSPYLEELGRIRATLGDTFARYLRSGVTSVADVGGPFWNYEVRDLAAKTPAAPRVAVTGPLISTYQPEALTTDDPPIIKVGTPEEARALVRRQIPRRPDFIKIWYIVRQGERPDDNLAIVRATIEESHAAGLRVAVHATQLETARAAVLAGADILVHSVEDKEVDDAFVRMLVERKVIYIPTLMVGERYRRVLGQQVSLTRPEWEIANPWVAGTWFDLRALPPADLPARVRALVEERKPVATNAVMLSNLKKLRSAGVTVALGTDAGNIGTPHGPAVFREMELMREAGLTPSEILVAATIHGARLMGREKELGTVEAGKLADFVVLDADPLADVMNMARIRFVVKDGVVYKPEELVPQTAEEVVQRQLNAYNARDLEAFLATYGEDIEGFEHPSNPMFKGLAAMRESYGRMFRETPALHCRIVGRLVLGERVIDHERVTGFGDRVVEAAAIYEVRGGLIRKVWFVRPTTAP